MAVDKSRVELWNAFLLMARIPAEKLHEMATGSKPQERRTFAGGTIAPLDQLRVSAVAFLCLAIEARIHHLVDELADVGRIKRGQARKYKKMHPMVNKWQQLPALAVKGPPLDMKVAPHDAVEEILRHRNAVMHVNFDKLSSLPSATDVPRLYAGFIDAMDHMNFVLGRTPRSRPEVMTLADF